MEEAYPGKKEEKKPARTTSLPAVPAAPRFIPDGLILEILSRLPARSVNRFKCVSPAWRDLITDPANRKKLPHALAGFLYSTDNRADSFLEFHFASVSAGAGPPVTPYDIPFLPPDEYLYVVPLDTCNGLLLCLAHMAPPPSSALNVTLETHYIVCNPATKRWVDLPVRPKVSPRIMARLAFDPAASFHFHVLEFERTYHGGHVTGVNIYSSRTGAWNHRECRSVEKLIPYFSVTSVFFHGMLHLICWLQPMNVNVNGHVVLVAVDMEGQVRETTRVPSSSSSSGDVSPGRIGLSQGCLHYARTTTSSLVGIDNNSNNNKNENTSQDTKVAAVWYMKDYHSKEWVLKHTVSNDELPSITAADYKVAAIHLDCDTIFFDSCDAGTLASYDLQSRKFYHIVHLEKAEEWQFLPYVPLFSDSLAGADGQ